MQVETATGAFDLAIRLKSAAMLVLFAATISALLAAPARGGGPGWSMGFGPWVFDGGAYGGYYPFHAATAAESYARGRAEIIRSQGEFNRLTSEAAINAEAARAQAITNAQDAVEAYFNIRRQAREYRQAERKPRPSLEAIERYARDARPDRLSPNELDSLTGRINWPILLQHDSFQQKRGELEELFDRWAVARNLGTAGNFGASEYLAVIQLTDNMMDQLRGQIHQLPPQDYVRARRFLESLAFEVQAANRPEAPLAAGVSQSVP